MSAGDLSLDKSRKINSFIEKCNDIIPGVQMTGGLANTTDFSLRQFTANGFLFDENGWTDKGIILAAIGGAEVESYSSYATGVQTIGDELEVTDTFGTCILTIDGMDAAEMFRKSIGDEIAAVCVLYCRCPDPSRRR